MSKRGFTLIELLVVIAIISLLSSIVLASLQGARVKARDSKRVQDLRQVQIALELFAQNNGGLFPLTVVAGAPAFPGQECWECGNDFIYDSTKLAVDLSLYLNPRPSDPQVPGGQSGRFPTGNYSGYHYITPSDRRDYKIALVGTIESKSNGIDAQGWDLSPSGIPMSLWDPHFWSANDPLAPGVIQNTISLSSLSNRSGWRIGCTVQNSTIISCP